eukprot:2903489-Heterocapsa_arctica.AAC.1
MYTSGRERGAGQAGPAGQVGPHPGLLRRRLRGSGRLRGRRPDARQRLRGGPSPDGRAGGAEGGW